jgi:hypothetical protein
MQLGVMPAKLNDVLLVLPSHVHLRLLFLCEHTELAREEENCVKWSGFEYGEARVERGMWWE